MAMTVLWWWLTCSPNIAISSALSILLRLYQLQFMMHIYKLHGLPTAIVSDCDQIFMSNLWKELFRLAGVQLRMSSAYHPQSDGQTERVNQCMETFLRCFANATPTKWHDWLHLA